MRSRLARKTETSARSSDSIDAARSAHSARDVRLRTVCFQNVGSSAASIASRCERRSSSSNFASSDQRTATRQLKAFSVVTTSYTACASS